MATTYTGDIVVLSGEEYGELMRDRRKLAEVEAELLSFQPQAYTQDARQLHDIGDIRPGMWVRNKHNRGYVYLVQANYGTLAVVARVLTISKADEWEVLV